LIQATTYEWAVESPRVRVADSRRAPDRTRPVTRWAFAPHRCLCGPCHLLHAGALAHRRGTRTVSTRALPRLARQAGISDSVKARGCALVRLGSLLEESGGKLICGPGPDHEPRLLRMGRFAKLAVAGPPCREPVNGPPAIDNR
jgi:hypothetical protein